MWSSANGWTTLVCPTGRSIMHEHDIAGSGKPKHSIREGGRPLFPGSVECEAPFDDLVAAAHYGREDGAAQKPAWRTKEQRPLSGDRANLLLAVVDLAADLRKTLSLEVRVGLCVITERVTFRHNTAGQLGKRGYLPATEKERCVNTVALENVENARGIPNVRPVVKGESDDFAAMRETVDDAPSAHLLPLSEKRNAAPRICQDDR
jgi:hypothetical protein